MAAMEDVLDLYEEPYDEKRLVVCYDESPRQLIGEVRQPLPPAPGQAGTLRRRVPAPRGAQPAAGARTPARLAGRDSDDDAQQDRFCARDDAVVQAYASADVIQVVLDNLNRHKIASLYEAFPPDEARALAKKLELHYTPKYGSWLNMAKIEFAVLDNMCLKGRIADAETLRRVIAANVTARNTRAEAVRWRFTAPDAREKLHRLYPTIQPD